MSYRNTQLPMDAVEITPSDTTSLNLVGLWVGGTGDVVVTTGAGNDVTFTGVPSGAVINLQVICVKAATTATDMVGFKA